MSDENAELLNSVVDVIDHIGTSMCDTINALAKDLIENAELRDRKRARDKWDEDCKEATVVEYNHSAKKIHVNGVECEGDLDIAYTLNEQGAIIVSTAVVGDSIFWIVKE